MVRAPRELPTGTVTLLFSDIEGSTALLLRLGERYAEALSAHRRLLRHAFGAGGGRELGTEGDSFFIVFRSAHDAVRSSVAAQRALAAHGWPEGVAVRVRMGLHSGEPTRHEDGYVGLDVHRAARIASTAHGGQVVISEVTRQLVESRLPPDVTLLDLGWHRLKDIEAPEHIFQLVVPGVEQRFPPLKSLGARTSLPVPLTPLVGRDVELEHLRASVVRGGVRLATLTGTGGVGKSRLALAVAASLRDVFRDGVFFIPLAAARDTEEMWEVIAAGLNVSDDRPAAEAVTDYLGARSALLVLDNLEQLQGAAEVVAALLAATEDLVVLGTSRRPLHAQGEHEHPVPPLELTHEIGVDAVLASGAAQLFVQQAAMVKPDFEITEDNAGDVSAICRRLDGLPLAIELAASRVRLLSPKALLSRLGQSLGLVAGDLGRPARQQTLRATIEWSCRLLTPELEVMFRRTGVFVGGCDLDALGAVAHADPTSDAEPDLLQQIAQLLDVSLIVVEEGAGGEPRVTMLETIRQYALERLEETGDLEVTRRGHAEFYAAKAERAHEHLNGPAWLASMEDLESEHDNLRAALHWSLLATAGPGGRGDEQRRIGGRLARALAPFWYQHGHSTEGRVWLERAVVLLTNEPGAQQGHLAHWLGVFLEQQRQNESAITYFERSLVLWRDLDDRPLMARELNSLAIARFRLGDPDAARSLLEESVALARDLQSDALLATALNTLGHVVSAKGDLDRAAEVFGEALHLHRTKGDSLGVAIDQQALALTNLRIGRTGEARRLLSATIDYVVRSGDTEFLADTLELGAGLTATDLAGGLQAARLAGAAEGVRQRAGLPVSALDNALLDQLLAPARTLLPSETWNAEHAAGLALTHEQTIALVETLANAAA